MNVASNTDKGQEKIEEDMDRAVRGSKTREEFERKMDNRDVSYKIKDETKEGKKQDYKTNQ